MRKMRKMRKSTVRVRAAYNNGGRRRLCGGMSSVRSSDMSAAITGGGGKEKQARGEGMCCRAGEHMVEEDESPLDVPLEWVRASPTRRPDVFREFPKYGTEPPMLPQKMPGDPPIGAFHTRISTLWCTRERERETTTTTTTTKCTCRNARAYGGGGGKHTRSLTSTLLLYIYVYVCLCVCFNHRRASTHRGGAR